MDTTPVNEITQVGISILAMVLATLVTVYAPRLLKALERRIGLDLPDPVEEEAERLALQAIAYAEEYARKKSKGLAAKVPSSDKLDAAAGYFRDHARGPVIRWLNGKIEDWIEAVLGDFREDGNSTE